MIYVSIFILLALFSLTKGKTNDRYYKVMFIWILFITCCRSSQIGIDTAGGYYSYYKYILGGGDLGFVEPSWIVLNKLSIELGLGYSGIIAMSGLLTLIPVAFVINKTCDNKCFAMLIYYGSYYVLNSFNIMRQCIAISFILLAIYYYINNRFVYSGIWFIIAFLFHKSAIVALVIIVFLKLEFKFSRIVVILLSTYLIGLFVSAKLFYLVSGRYANYLVSDGYGGFRESIFLPAIMAAILNVFFVFVVWPEYDRVKCNPWFLISIVGIIFMNMTVRLEQGTRVVLYFTQAQMVFVPNYVRSLKNKNNKKVISCLFVIYLALNFYRILHTQLDSLLPYKFFWEV